jgi:hypothetical protein
MKSEQLESAKKLFFILLGVDIAVTAVVGLNAFSTAGTLRDIQSGARTVDQSLLGSLEFWDGFSKLIFLTMVGVGLGLVKWLNSCYRFAKESLGASGFRNEGWTASGWIIPIFNLFRPYQVINEIYKAGAPSYSASDGWKKESGSGLLLTWWIFWAVIHFVGWIMTKQLLRSSLRDDISLQQGIVLTEMQAWSCVISLVVAGLWFVVANHLTQRLLDRPSRLSSSPLKNAISDTGATVSSPPTVVRSSPAMIVSNQPQLTPSGSVQQNFTVDENAIYAAIANELESGATDKGLWIRLFAECDGDENRTKVAYIKQRAEKLIALEQSRLGELQRQRSEEAARLETIRLEGLSLREQLSSSNLSAELREKLKSLSSSLSAVTFRNKVRANQLDEVEAMLKDNPLLVATIDSDDKSPLHIAVSEQYVKMCQLLLENGAATDVKNMFGATPLDFALKNRNQEIVEMISAIK